MLYSWRNPSHEQRVREITEEVKAQRGLNGDGPALFLSSELYPLRRDFPRLNADHRQVEDEAVQFRRLLDLELAVGDQRDVERGAADVGADDVAQTELLGEVLRADDTADRSRDQRPRQLACLDRDRATVRGHDPQVEAGARVLGHRPHAPQLIARGLRRVRLD
jgi:hypothetical protein